MLPGIVNLRPLPVLALLGLALVLVAAAASAAEPPRRDAEAGAGRPAGPADRAPRLALGPIRNDAGGVAGARLAAAVCQARTCLPQALTGLRLDLDLARARRMGAGAALVGSIWREPGGRVLSLALFGAGRQPLRTWVLSLDDRGSPRQADLASLAREVDDALGIEAAPAPTPTPPSAPAPALAPTSPPPPPPPPPPTPTPTPTPAPAPAPAQAPTSPWLVIETGLESSVRSLRFPSGGTAPVGYSVALPATPRLGLEVRPLRRLGAPLAGLGLFAEGAAQDGIRLPVGDRVHRATSRRLVAGLRWRVPVGRRLLVAPALAWAQESFVVGPAGGTKVPGLPDTRLEGGSAGLDLELALPGDRVALLLGGRATWWWRARELAGGPGFYPEGTATGAEGWAGAEVALAGPLSVRLLGRAALTRWSLGPDPSGAYAVRSARAREAGGLLVARLRF